MEKRKEFIQLNFFNIEGFYKDGKLKRGALVKYRHSIDIINNFSLVPEKNEWQYGVVASVHWHIVRPLYTLGTYEPQRICYDITVYNTLSPATKEMISVDNSEIFLLTHE
jgi:hypothetical protein